MPDGANDERIWQTLHSALIAHRGISLRTNQAARWPGEPSGCIKDIRSAIVPPGKIEYTGDMVLTFLRHGSNIWLALGLAALIAGFAGGVLPFAPFWVAIGALTFYVSEYGFHRFGFHAEPSRFAFASRSRSRRNLALRCFSSGP